MSSDASATLTATLCFHSCTAVLVQNTKTASHPPLVPPLLPAPPASSQILESHQSSHPP